MLVPAKETLVMLKSETEKIIRRCIEENKAQFTEEQVKCLSQIILEITEEMIAEALSLYRPKSGR
jgi:hypothetical protein